MVVGEFEGPIDFGDSLLLGTAGYRDAFVAKYAGATGAHLFSRRYGGADFESALAVAVDSMDNIVMVGKFSGAADFGGPNPLVSIGPNNVVVAKYTPVGAYLWAKPFHAMEPANSGRQVPRAVTVDDTGDILFGGEFCGTISFGGSEMSSAAGCSTDVRVFPDDTFVVQLAGHDGSHISSIRTGSRTGVSDIAVAAGRRLYLTGNLDGFAEIGGRVLTPVNHVDAFILSVAPL